jgi:glyoxylase-like metal-dependent hydrolase (beta-lactamase superfamily II)
MIGDLQFTCVHVPGHSPDSLCFLFQAVGAEEAGGVLFGGDVLFQGSVGRTDFPHGDGPMLIRGIQQKLFGLPDGTVVLPGHGPATTIGVEKVSNPYARLKS